MTCPICGSSYTIKIRGKNICRTCGTIIDDSNNHNIVYGYMQTDTLNTVLLLDKRIKKYLIIFDELCELLSIPNYLADIIKRRLIKILNRFKGERFNPYIVISSIIIATLYENSNYLVTYKDLEKIIKVRFGYKLDRSKIIQFMYKLRENNIIKPIKPDYDIAINLYLNKVIKELNITARDKYYYEKISNVINKIKQKLWKYIKGKSVKTASALIIYLAEMSLAHKENRRPYFNQTVLTKLLGISRFTLRDRIAEIYNIYRGQDFIIIKKKFRMRN